MDFYYVLYLDLSMDLRLVHIMVIHYDYDMGKLLVQHLDLLIGSHLVHIMVQC